MTDEIKFRGLIIGMFQNCKGEKSKATEETDQKSEPKDTDFDVELREMIFGSYEDWLYVKENIKGMAGVKSVPQKDVSDHDTIMKMSTT